MRHLPDFYNAIPPCFCYFFSWFNFLDKFSRIVSYFQEDLIQEKAKNKLNKYLLWKDIYF